MTETLATIRTRVQRFVGTAINATIDDAIAEYHKTLQQEYDYRFMQTSGVIDVGAGDTTFPLPSDFKQEVNPEISDADGTGYRRMKKILKDGIESRNTGDTGRPRMYRIWGGAGHLYAKADQDYTFPLEYFRWLPTPSETAYADDDRAQAFLNEVHKAIEYFAISAGKRRMGKLDEANYWWDLAEHKRELLEDDDLDIELANMDMQMEIPG
ncbi:MAG: hypothetical protein HKM93_08900 [Desulfobacteraceae bacterium]|nr:hypothetical protein [Desulfobacteraceae bacterium]